MHGLELLWVALQVTGCAAFPQLFNNVVLSARDLPFNDSLPNVTILATGGTIAGSAPADTQTSGYTGGVLGVDVLIDAVPQIHNISNVKGIQVTNLGSPQMTSNITLDLARQVQAAADDPYCQGIVVTHGTSTLEESAFFVELGIHTEKPVVFVGTMRPATAMGADGPINLYQAVTLAASPKGKGRGVMVVLNDRIGSAVFTSKMHALSLDTFKAPEQGYLGFFYNNEPYFYWPPARPLGHHYFNVTTLPDELPQVDILYMYQSVNPALVRAAVESGAKGIVLAGSGAGVWASSGLQEFTDLAEEYDTQFVISTQNGDGGLITSQGNRTPNTPNQYGGWHLTPRKARMMLQMALGAGYSSEQLRTLFSFGQY